MKHLDIKEKLPLQGVSLVEASAGTGKTFSITKIVLQALLSDIGPNASIGIDEILVVTFTEAATKELRSRIRGELHEFEKYLTEPKESNSEYDAIVKTSNKNSVEQLKLIRTALLNIDLSAIYTIHSFCQRMLTENAFESKIAFGAELLTDTSELIREIAENFWRKNFVNITEAEKALYSDIKFETILDLTKTFIKYNNVELVNTSTENLETIKQQYSEIFTDIYKQLSVLNIDELEQDMLKFFGKYSPNLVKQLASPKFEATIKEIIKKIRCRSLTFEDLTIFSYCYITDNRIHATKKKAGFVLPETDFFDIGINVPQLVELQKIKSTALYRELYEYTQPELERIKEARHILTFDDLINKLHTVLQEESTLSVKPLTELIRSKYKIAFVDEFQDTDKQQYSIFRNIFEQSDNHGFFMIGDPKQSIYKFRGADIFSYLKAKNDANHKYTLLKNFRSEQGIIDAVNTVFQFRKPLIKQNKLEKVSLHEEAPDVPNVASDNDNSAANEKAAVTPLLLEDNVFVCSTKGEEEGIDFHPAAFGHSQKKRVLKIDGSPQNLHLWLVDGFNSAFIEHNIAKNIALEITKLIPNTGAGNARFEANEANSSRPLELGDVAILVNTNKQAAKIKHELSKSNIPAVIQHTAKIFASTQATDVKLWLKAIIKPIESNIRPLFVTDILRKGVNEIATIADSEILRITEELTLLKKKCHKDGVFSSFIHFVNVFGVMENALKDANGERIVTNYFHIADLLHKHELKTGRNIEKTLTYLEQEMQDEGSDDETQEQLESDKKAVRIMTIHKSKGLQFPVVFCPYIWSNAITKGEDKKKVLLFNERENGEYIQKLDLGADKELFQKHQAEARMETLAEHVRLLYVALTRAANRCYLAIGNDPVLGKSVLSYIFTVAPKEFVYELSGGGIGKRLEKLKTRCIDNLCACFECSDGELSKMVKFERKGMLHTQPHLHEAVSKNKQSLSVRDFQTSVFQKWSVGSFSGLVANIPYSSDAAKDGIGAFSLPKGKTFGSAVHKIFENYYLNGSVIFSDPALRKSYFETPLAYESFFRISDKNELEKRFQVAEDMFKNVLSANIVTNDSTFSLDQIPLQDAKPEFKFYHRINKISPKLLKELFAKFATGRVKAFSESLENLGFSMKKGYMYGEIDLLFRKNDKYYILDWKTNHLGADFANYIPEKLEKNMCKHLYMLQAHVYSLATHLFLKQQLKNYDYDTNFGGFIYLYTRGVDNKGNGIYLNKPARALIENMEKKLCT